MAPYSYQIFSSPTESFLPLPKASIQVLPVQLQKCDVGKVIKIVTFIHTHYFYKLVDKKLVLKWPKYSPLAVVSVGDQRACLVRMLCC